MIKIKRLFFVLTFFACFFISEVVNSQKINQFDSNNKRTGVWKKQYPNKRIRYIGQFENGKEVGVFKFYHISSSKHPISIKTFYKNSDSLFVQFYKLSGKLESEGIVKGRKRSGTWKYFFINGKVMSEENYKDGKLNGEQFIYYPNGTLTEKSNYVNGLQEGVCEKYSSKNILIEAITYQNGKPNGLAKYFELNGNLKESGNYKNGKRIGEWNYFMDGEVSSKKEKKKTFSRKKVN
jgi:antitoxin component YwqK of YwqJK toxin-antitoxin module